MELKAGFSERWNQLDMYGFWLLDWTVWPNRPVYRVLPRWPDLAGAATLRTKQPQPPKVSPQWQSHLCLLRSKSIKSMELTPASGVMFKKCRMCLNKSYILSNFFLKVQIFSWKSGLLGDFILYFDFRIWSPWVKGLTFQIPQMPGDQSNWLDLNHIPQPPCYSLHYSITNERGYLGVFPTIQPAV